MELTTSGIVCVSTQSHKFLLLKGRFSKSWSFPKGYIEKGEDPLESAIRELEEEIGVSLTFEDILLTHDGEYLHVDTSVKLPKPIKRVPSGVKHIRFYVYYMDEEQVIRLSKEHSSFRWIDINHVNIYNMLSPEFVQVGTTIMNTLSYT